MKIFKKLKVAALKLKKQIIVLYYAYKHPDIGWLPKLLIVITLAYALSPIDLIPDFIPILGYLDDLIILPILITLALKVIPANVIEDAKLRSESEPVKLGKNWVAGILFIMIWIVVIGALGYAVYNYINNRSLK